MTFIFIVLTFSLAYTGGVTVEKFRSGSEWECGLAVLLGCLQVSALALFYKAAVGA